MIDVNLMLVHLWAELLLAQLPLEPEGYLKHSRKL